MEGIVSNNFIFISLNSKIKQAHSYLNVAIFQHVNILVYMRALSLMLVVHRICKSFIDFSQKIFVWTDNKIVIRKNKIL